MKRWLLALAFPALLAAAPTPLVVGVVRDRHGIPVANARVSAGNASTRTDAQGTFALEAADVKSITIACTYCEPLTVPVNSDEPIVAFVRRYDALAQTSPSERDIASVPYGHAESIAALAPFTVLENSSHLLPGAQVSDRGASPRGGLVFDNGIPQYDVASNQSPFVAFPSYTLQRVTWLPPSDAFLYGDLAGGGTLLANTHGSDAWSGIAAAGSSSAFRGGQTSDDLAWSAAGSGDPNDARVRADASSHSVFGDNAIDVSALAAEDRAIQGRQYLDTSDTGVRLDYAGTRANRVNASLLADGGGYSGSTSSLNYSARWSDVQAQAGVTTNTPVQFFTDAAARVSSGYYATSSAALPLTAGTIAQTRIDIGMQTSGDRYSARLGAGAFDMLYAGGSRGSRTTLAGGMIAPSFSGSYAFDPHWTLELQAAESFVLPTILEAFVYPTENPSLVFDRNSFVEETLTYGDLRRFHTSLTSLSERVTGLDNGTIDTFGASADWQIAPALSLRAWVLRDNDRTLPYEAVYRFGARAQPATVGSYWLTYESAGLRVDAIYRQDLLDYRSDPHFDASASAPIGRGWRVFAATERRAGVRTVSIGLRAQTP